MNEENKNPQDEVNKNKDTSSSPDISANDDGEWGFWKRLTRRRHYLIDKKLQLNFAFLLIIVGGINVVFFGFLFYFFSEHTTAMYEPLLIESAIKENIARIENQKFFMTIAIAGLFECILILLLGIFFSHRIAGPLFKISKYLKEVANGRYPGLIKLRKDDMLKNFAENVNSMIISLKDRYNLK